MIKFYIDGVERQVQVSPLFTETLDETLDSGSCILGFSSREQAYKPDTPFQIVDDTTSETLNFVVVSDIVEVVDKATPQYRHTITFTQRSRLLSKYALRNMVFSQPARPIVKAVDTALYDLSVVEEEIVFTENNAGANNYHLILSKRAKAKRVWCEISGYAFTRDGGIVNVVNLSGGTITVDIGIVGGAVLKNNFDCSVGYNDLDISPALLPGGTELYITIESVAGLTPTLNVEKIVVHAQFFVETYYYSLYDVLTKIQKALRKTTNLYANSSVFTLPTSGNFYDTLQQPAPEFTFTQMNAYEAIDQVAKYLDGVITLSATNVLGIEYFNDLSNATAFTSGKADQNSNISEDTYINGLIVNYQNGRAKEAIWYPSHNNYARATSLELGIATNDSLIAITGNEPIESIEKIIVLVSFYSELLDALYFDLPVDITNYVFEKSLYDLLPKTNTYPLGGDYTAKTDYNTLYYQKGNNYIYIGEITETVSAGKTYNLPRVLESAIREQYGASVLSSWSKAITISSPTDPRNLYYKVLYRPLFNGRLKIEGQENKFEGEMIIDQSAGKVDLLKLGNSMFGLAVKLGQESKIVVQEFKTFATRSKKGMVYADGYGNKWFANKVKTTIFPSYVSCEIEFSKNFNKLSQYIQVNQSKRFYEISNELTTIAEDNYCEYVYIGKGADSIYTGKSQQTCADNLLSSTSMYLNFIRQLGQPFIIDFARIKTWTDYNSGGAAYAISTDLNIPVIMFGTGNSLVYKIGFDSPISAGTRVTTSVPYVSSVIPYADTDGFFEIADIDFRWLKGLDASFQKICAEELPALNADILDSDHSEVMIDIDMLRFYKDANEIFKLNYQLTFLPYQINDVFIGRPFIEKNVLQNNYRSGITKVFASTTAKYSILDFQALGTELGDLTNDYQMLHSINTEEMGYCEQFTIRDKLTLVNLDTTNYTSWCITDEFNNIIIAFNKSIGVSEVARFTMFSRHTRI